MEGWKEMVGPPGDEPLAEPPSEPASEKFVYESREERIQLLRWQGYSESEIAALTRSETNRGWMVVALATVVMATGLLGYFSFNDEGHQTEEYLRADVERPKDSAMPFMWGREDLTLGDKAEPKPQAAEAQEDTAETTPQIVERKNPMRSTQKPRQSTAPMAPVPAAVTKSVQHYSGPVPDSVERETQRALRSGKPQLWEEGGERGYVIVSGEVDYGERVCRQVSYSMIKDGGQVTSPSIQWCREGKRGKWVPDNRSPY